MKHDNPTYRSFLLGKLKESRREEVESRFLEDPEIFELIEAIEAELLDEWARGELGPEDQRALERLCLRSPRLAERSRFASALADRREGARGSSIAARQRRHAWLLAASLTGLVLLSLATSSLFVGGDRPTAEVAEVVLWGDSLRGGGEAERVVLDTSAEHLAVKIDLGSSAPFPSYELEVRGPDGAPVWAPPPLSPERLSWGLALVTEIPGRLLEAGSYQVELRGLRGSDREQIAFYPLEVVRESSTR